MPSRAARRQRRALLPALPLLALWGLSAAVLPAAAGEAGLEFVPADASLFAAPGTEGAALPPAGSVLVLGRLSGGGFAVAKPEQVEVLDPAGRQLPLRVEQERIWRDPILDNSIVSLDFSFTADAGDVAERAGTFRLRWGPDVQGPVELAGAPVLDPAGRESCFEFRLISRGAPAPGDMQSSLTVIADSRAEYYFLWYLLPMLTIVALLVVRRLTARAGDAGAGGGADARGGH